MHARQRLSTPKAILFDFDDTLIDTWPFLWSLYQETFAHFGVNLTDLMDEKTCREKAIRNGRQTFTDVFGQEVGLQAQDYFLGTYGATFIHQVTPLPGASKTLALLKEKKIPTGIVSNKDSTFLNNEIKALGWDMYFETIVGRDTAGPKPNAAPALHALSEMSLKAGLDIWFIGDSIVDHETARNAGCFSIGFGNIDHTPDISVANWNQFEEILEGIHLK